MGAIFARALPPGVGRASLPRKAHRPQPPPVYTPQLASLRGGASHSPHCEPLIAKSIADAVQDKAYHSAKLCRSLIEEHVLKTGCLEAYIESETELGLPLNKDTKPAITNLLKKQLEERGWKVNRVSIADDVKYRDQGIRAVPCTRIIYEIAFPEETEEITEPKTQNV